MSWNRKYFANVEFINFHVARSIRKECMWWKDSEGGAREEERGMTLSIHEKMRAKATFESISFESTLPSHLPPPSHVNHPPFLDRKTPVKSYDYPMLAAQSCIYGQAHIYTHLRTYFYTYRNIHTLTHTHVHSFRYTWCSERLSNTICITVYNVMYSILHMSYVLWM